MIRKLKRKFIFTNMLLVTSILFIVFFTLLLTSYRRMQDGTAFAMNRAFELPTHETSGLWHGNQDEAEPDPFRFIPTFLVLLDEKQALESVRSYNLNLEGEDLQPIVEQVLHAEDTQGYLSKQHLRYLVRKQGSQTQIVFADIHYQNSAFLFFVLQCGLGFLLSLAAFFCVSLFLANLAIKPIQKSWTQQKQFIADASHELKTPLTVILANLDILTASPSSTIQEQSQWIRNTQEEAERMKQLVQELLFLARADTHEIVPVFHSFSLSDAVWSCTLPFEPLAYEKKLQFFEEIEPNLHFTGDETQIKQLVSILLENACKYGKAGGKVEISLQRQDEHIHIAVTNDGARIPKEDLPHIFERFYRSDKSRQASEGSFGLGLAIAKAITETHHGKITAESDEKRGTSFSVLLPLNTP
ncbi:MAG: HAMP domain-containing sensor histidine kinase [bacterium]|nr:HAMP domain-containing sensor histidine kinase [bacterium]